MLPIDGKSGNLMSLIRCGMFISLTAETARAGAAAMPACKPSNSWKISCSRHNAQYNKQKKTRKQYHSYDLHVDTVRLHVTKS